MTTSLIDLPDLAWNIILGYYCFYDDVVMFSYISKACYKIAHNVILDQKEQHFKENLVSKIIKNDYCQENEYKFNFPPIRITNLNRLESNTIIANAFKWNNIKRTLFIHNIDNTNKGLIFNLKKLLKNNVKEVNISTNYNVQLLLNYIYSEKNESIVSLNLLSLYTMGSILSNDITNLINLSYLVINDSQIEDISAISNCKKLIYLNINRCYKVEDYSFLEHENLKSIDVFGFSNQNHTFKYMEVSKHFKNFSNISLKNCHCHIKLDYLTHCKSLNLHDCYPFEQNYNLLKNLDYINLSYTDITSTEGLGNIHTLILNNCNALLDISHLTNNYKVNLKSSYNIDVNTISSLINCKDLILSIKNLDSLDYLEGIQAYYFTYDSITNNKIVSLNVLRNCHNIKIKDCIALTEVSQLGNLHSIKIYNGHNLTDVSALGNVHSLTLEKCISLEDISKLTNNYELNLRGCTKIKDISSLENCVILNLSNCTGIEDFSCLGKQEDLNLSHTKIKDVSNLKNVIVLNLSYCKNIQTVEALGDGNIKDLKLFSCTSITNVSTLGNIHKLNISGCRKIESLDGLGNNHTLYMSNLNKVKDVSMLGNLKYINMSGCNKITTIKNLINVRFLNIKKCNKIKDAKLLNY